MSSGSSSSHTPKRGVAAPPSSAPIRKPTHTTVRSIARRRCVSQTPSPSFSGARFAASARCPPIWLSVPVTNVMLTVCLPTRESGVIRSEPDLYARVRGVPAHERNERAEREEAVGVYVSGYGGKADGKQFPVLSGILRWRHSVLSLAPVQRAGTQVYNLMRGN